MKLLKLLFINNHAVNGSQHSLTNRFMYIVYNISLMFCDFANFQMHIFLGGGGLVGGSFSALFLFNLF